MKEMHSVTIQNMVKGSNWAIFQQESLLTLRATGGPVPMIQGGKAASQSEKISFALSKGDYVWRVRQPGWLPFEIAFKVDGNEIDYEFTADQKIDYYYQPSLLPVPELPREDLRGKSDPRDFILNYRPECGF